MTGLGRNELELKLVLADGDGERVHELRKRVDEP